MFLKYGSFKMLQFSYTFVFFEYVNTIDNSHKKWKHVYSFDSTSWKIVLPKTYRTWIMID